MSKRSSSKVHTGEGMTKTMHVSSQSWFCYEHRCWNSPHRRLCLCAKPEEKW